MIVYSPERLIIMQKQDDNTTKFFFRVQKIMLLLYPAFLSAERF